LIVTVTNTTSVPVGPINMAGGGVSAPFSAFQNCANVTLPPGGTCSISYVFTPTSLDAASTTSDFTLDDEPFSISLTGNGVAAPIPALSGGGLTAFVGLLALLGVAVLRWRRG